MNPDILSNAIPPAIPGSPSRPPGASPASEIQHERVQQAIRFRFNPIRNLTPESLVSKLERWELGYLRELALVFDAVKKRDWDVRIVADKREKDVARLPWEIVAIDGADEARAEQHKATLLGLYNSVRTTDVLNQNVRGSFRLLVRQMADAIGKGYAVHEILWRPQPGNARAPLSVEFQFCPLWFFENLTGRLRFLRNDFDLDGTPLEPNGWLVSAGDGLMLPTVVAWMFRRLPLQDWLSFSDKFGMPGVIGECSSAKDSAGWTAMKEAVASLVNDWSAVVSQGEKMNLLEAKGGTGNLPFPPLIEYFDRKIHTLWRGGNLSTNSAKDSVGADLQNEEKDVLVEDDAPWIEETLHEQVSKFAIRYVHGDEEPAAYLKFCLPKKDNTDAAIKRFTFAIQNGIALGQAAVRDALALPEPAEDEETVGRDEELPPAKATPSATPSDVPPDQEDDDTLANEDSAIHNPRSAFAAALRQDFAPVASVMETWISRAAAIAQIQNADLKAAKADALMREIDQLAADIQIDPASARVLQQIIATKIAEGLQRPALANGDFDGHPFRGNQYVDSGDFYEGISPEQEQRVRSDVNPVFEKIDAASKEYAGILAEEKALKFEGADPDGLKKAAIEAGRNKFFDKIDEARRELKAKSGGGVDYYVHIKPSNSVVGSESVYATVEASDKDGEPIWSVSEKRFSSHARRK